MAALANVQQGGREEVGGPVAGGVLPQGQARLRAGRRGALEAARCEVHHPGGARELRGLQQRRVTARHPWGGLGGVGWGRRWSSLRDLGQ